MLEKNLTALFLIRKSIYVILALLVCTILIFGMNVQIFFGLIIGYIISIFRLKGLSGMIMNIVDKSQNNTKIVLVLYIFSQIVTMIILFLSVQKSIPFFFAISTGILTISITILLNSFTEAIGFTKNNFEQL